MERALKRLLRIYPVARNWITLSNYMAPLQSVQNVSQMYSTNLTDCSQLEDANRSLMGRNMYNNLKKLQEPIKILELAATNYTNMSLHDALNTLTALFKVSKMKNDISSTNHLGFTQSNTLLIQSLLQMIRGNINEMSLNNIIFTTFLLNKLESTPLRDALLIALPMVFETQLPTKLDTDDLPLLLWSLRFIIEYNIQNSDVYDIIFKSLWKQENNLNISAAKSIFYSLCHISELSPIACELLSKVQNILISMAKELNIQEITMICTKLSVIVVSNRHGSIFYNEIFLDALVNSALSSNINFVKGIYILKILNDFNHVHIPFLEYLAARCFENQSLLKDMTFHKMSIFLEGLVNADYKPLFWDTIKDTIMENIKIDNGPYNRLFIRLALHLVALDCYSSNLLNYVFSIFIRNNEPLRDVYTREILLLYQSVKTLYPMYNGSWPQEHLLEYANTIKLIPPTYSLQPGLERALGGPQYVHNNLRTKLGHYIDHVVVMRKGGYPIAINIDSPNNNVIYIEDLQTPSESQMIFIFNLPDTAYAVNSQRLKSTWALKIKSIEALTKSNTIIINSSCWMKLPEHERIPYLMQAIRLKCDDFLVSTN
ncbi:uncharacterized protein LOC105190972 isoform X2 [Harpegnathos saltator]|uniref:uncharacterized protein LOC105190972 isoform X2 n=1 Tax=Harpegnathos saltator TaxID=610380 RepID=UPI00094911BE|nr:uncharacterized protein LOC105190972 isoform X2 [Harpegnathos saltator]